MMLMSNHSAQGFGLKDYSQSKEVIEGLARAVFNKFTARILHRALHHEPAPEREVDPYKLWYVNNGLYLVGHDHLKNDLRVFAVECIRAVNLTVRRFEIPENFKLEEFKERAFSMIWEERREVKIRFPPSQASYIRERTWHASQQIETERSGSIILRLRVADLDEVKQWLMEFGTEAEVLEPQALRTAVTGQGKTSDRRER
jgi:predicted DNA-binding transcriptional regulator YafY